MFVVFVVVEKEKPKSIIICSGTSGTKPSDVRNGDLVSLLLAATPPYLYNIPLVPQTFFFSEMLKSFVQAKTERQNYKIQQVSLFSSIILLLLLLFFRICDYLFILIRLKAGDRENDLGEN